MVVRARRSLATSKDLVFTMSSPKLFLCFALDLEFWTRWGGTTFFKDDVERLCVSAYTSI